MGVNRIGKEEIYVRRDSSVWLCHKLDWVTDYAQWSVPSGSNAGSGAPRRKSLITTVSMFVG